MAPDYYTVTGGTEQAIISADAISRCGRIMVPSVYAGLSLYKDESFSGALKLEQHNCLSRRSIDACTCTQIVCALWVSLILFGNLDLQVKQTY